MSLLRPTWLGRALYRLARLGLLIFPPRAARVRCLVISQGRVVLVKNWVGSGKWSLPGGGMHRRESAARAARRELAEELRLDLPARDITELGAKKLVEDGIAYRAELCAARLKEPPELSPSFELMGAQWFDLASLPADRSPAVDAAHRGLKQQTSAKIRK